jgi:hypothetical protein
MESQHPSLSLRVALGAILASALTTQLAFGQTAQDAAPNQDEPSMKIRIEFNEASMTATLYDNPSARDFASMLPLDLTIDDYSTNEKIAYLPRKLTEEGSGPFGNEGPGDLAYYAPWGKPGLFLRELPLLQRTDPPGPTRRRHRPAADARRIRPSHRASPVTEPLPLEIRNLGTARRTR